MSRTNGGSDFGNTLILSFGVGIIGVVVGAFLAGLVTRTDLPWKKAICTLVMASFITPPFPGTFAGSLLAGPNAGALYVPQVSKEILSDSKLKSDAIHPNGTGHRLIAERLAKKSSLFSRTRTAREPTPSPGQSMDDGKHD